jgi:hypothetical protein
MLGFIMAHTATFVSIKPSLFVTNADELSPSEQSTSQNKIFFTIQGPQGISKITTVQFMEAYEAIPCILAAGR